MGTVIEALYSALRQSTKCSKEEFWEIVKGAMTLFLVGRGTLTSNAGITTLAHAALEIGVEQVFEWETSLRGWEGGNAKQTTRFEPGILFACWPWQDSRPHIRWMKNILTEACSMLDQDALHPLSGHGGAWDRMFLRFALKRLQAINQQTTDWLERRHKTPTENIVEEIVRLQAW